MALYPAPTALVGRWTGEHPLTLDSLINDMIKDMVDQETRETVEWAEARDTD